MILIVIGLLAQDYTQALHSSQGYLIGITRPLYPVGIVLLLVSVVLFTLGFYLILKEKIQH